MMALDERKSLMTRSAPLILRIGLSLVYLWFGTQQLLHTEQWISLIPQYVMDISHLTSTTLVHFNGVFEIIFGILLLLGFYTRAVAFLLALHMLDIMYVVGYNSIGVRDFGISMATISAFFYGGDDYSLDSWLAKRKRNVETTL